MTTWEILQGDAAEQLRSQPAERFHCAVTSPPYWGLRDYGQAGQIGLEESLGEYLERLVGVFREVRRVLRPDGTLWLNMGDAYCGSLPGNARRDHSGTEFLETRGGQGGALAGFVRARREFGSLKPKDLIGLPWRAALALQADGWYLRADCVWHKPNPMPESVSDRPTKAHEYVFLLAKGPRYFYDAQAVAEPAIHAGRIINYDGTQKNCEAAQDSHMRTRIARNVTVGQTRNLRTVWKIPTQPYKGAHFATFPERLVEPCVLAGTSAEGCCSACGAPRIRNVEVTYENPGNRTTNGPRSLENRAITAGFARRLEKRVGTLGWSPGCACGAACEPCRVLDPFAGSGTVGAVSRRLGRSFVGIELNPAYCDLARARIGAVEVT